MKLKQLFALTMFLFVGMLCVTSVNATTLNDNLTSAWLLDENTGTTAEDEIGTNDGTLTNIDWITGKINSGVYFKGPSTTSNLNTGITYNFNNDFTLTSWIKLDDITNNAYVIFGGYYSTTNYWILMHRADKSGLTFQYATGGGGIFINANSGHTTDMQMVTLTRSGNTLQFYINGVSEGSGTISGTFNTAQTFHIGRWSTDSNSLVMKGIIDEVYIYDRALTSTEVEDLYDRNVLGEQPLFPDPPANLSFTNITFNNVTLTNDTYWNTTNIDLYTEVLNTSTNGNVNQTYYLYNSTDDLVNSSQFTTNNINGSFNLSSLQDDIYQILFFAENNETNVTSTNYTFTIDTTPPTINNNIPSEINSYILTLNSSCTDTNLNYCNITINNQTTALNSTNITLTENGNLSYTITAEDLAGNIITEEGIVLVNPIVYIGFNISGTPISNFSFGGRSSVGNYVNYTVYNDGLVLGNNSLLFKKLGYVEQSFIINFNTTMGTNYSYDVVYAMIDLYIRDKVTGDIINSTNFSISVISNVGIINYTTNGTRQFQNLLFESGIYRVTVSNVDYITEDILFTFTNEEIITQNIYMLEANESKAGTVVIEVVDGLGQGLSGVTVQALQWDTSSSSYIRVAESITGLDGKSTLNIILDDKVYKFQATDNGNTVLSPQYRILASQDGITITLSLDTGVGERTYFLQDFIYNATEVSYINNISTLKINWVNENGLEEEVCFISYRYRGLSQVKLNEYCDTGVTGEFIQEFNINTSQNIMIRAELKRDGVYIPLKAFRYPSTTSLTGVFNLTNLSMFIIPLLFFLSIAVGIRTESLQLGSMLIMLSAGFSLWLVPTLTNGAITAFLTFISGLVIWGLEGGRK